MSGFLGESAVDVAGTWLAGALTLAVWSYLAGEQRLFAWGQRLLAGLLTGYLVLLAVTEVLVPRLLVPLAGDLQGRLDLLVGALLAISLVVAPYLPRSLAAPPVALLLAGVAAFALGGAVVGTLLPQAVAAMLGADPDPATLLPAALGMGLTVLVVLSFLHGVPRGRVLRVTSAAGHWIIVAGLGAWLGFLILSGLVLLVDRLDFLLLDVLGLER